MGKVIFTEKNKYPNFIVLAGCFLFFLCSCNPDSSTLEAKNASVSEITASPTNPDIIQSDLQNQSKTKSASFKGVNLQTDIPAVSDIEASEEPAVILEDENDKPDSVQSRHISLKLKGEYANRRKESGYLPEINIYPIAEFRQAFAKSNNYVEVFDKKIKSLQNIISKKTAKKEELPRIPFYDGSPEILAHFKYTTFKNGAGVLYITQYNVDYATTINNQELVCVFQGLTSDKKYYVSATFPVELKGLPESIYDNKFGDYKLPQTYFDAKTNLAEYAKYKKYLLSIETLLNKAKPGEFNPDLDKIEKTISSLEINWNE